MIAGGDLFLYFYKNKDGKVPVSNPWTLDLGKLIVQNVFVDVELIQTLVENYHSVTRIVRMPSEDPLLVVTRSAIIDCFMLNIHAITKIDFPKFE